ncbi:obstructor-B [Carabus blaptoides fortunei]
MKSTLALCFALLATALAQHQQQHNEGLINPQHQQQNENLLRQFQQWQPAHLSPGVQQPSDTFDAHAQSLVQQKYNTGGQYPGNPWLQPTPAPAPPQQPQYVQPSPPSGNQWYQPTTQPPPPVPNQPQYGGGYYPPTSPPQPTPPPVSPEVEALRQYCLQPRGQFPSNKCNTYINCWDDVIVEQECPAGLLFSEYGFCDYPYNVDCKGRPNPEATPPPTLQDDTAHCPTPYGTYRSAQNCSEFYVCVNSVPIKFSCSAELYYNTVLGVCDYPYNVDCINPRPIYPDPVPTPGLPPPSPIFNPYQTQRKQSVLVQDNRQCVPNSVYRLEPDCSSVAICRAGKTEVLTCGQHTAYDAEKGVCVARHLARC